MCAWQCPLISIQTVLPGVSSMELPTTHTPCRKCDILSGFSILQEATATKIALGSI